MEEELQTHCPKNPRTCVYQSSEIAGPSNVGC